MQFYEANQTLNLCFKRKISTNCFSKKHKILIFRKNRKIFDAICYFVNL